MDYNKEIKNSMKVQNNWQNKMNNKLNLNSIFIDVKILTKKQKSTVEL